MKNQILAYVNYNLWANNELVNYLKNLDEKQINQTIISSFPSIRLTYLHICDAEVIWQKRIEDIQMTVFPSHTFEGNSLEMFELILENSSNFVKIVQNADEDFFQIVKNYKTITLGETSQNVYDMIHHCMNHSTYHRGQIITMLRQLGCSDLPHLDFMLWKIKGSPILI